MGLVVAVLNEVCGIGGHGVLFIKQVGLLFGQPNPLFEKRPDGGGVLDHPDPAANLPGKGVGMGQGGEDAMMRKHVPFCPPFFDESHLKAQDRVPGPPQGLKIGVQSGLSTPPEMAAGIAINQDLKVWVAMQFPEHNQGLPAPIAKPTTFGIEAVVMAQAVI